MVLTECDNNGNIIKIKELQNTMSRDKIEYKYDSFNRLIEERNYDLSRIFVYSYHANGDINQVKTYAYATSGYGSIINTATYTYSNRKLTGINNTSSISDFANVSISGYDAVGNPASYKGKSLTWARGRMLKKYGSNEYWYDAGGIRQRKVANGVTHEYYTSGDRIILETRGDSQTMYYMYDASGVCGITYNNTPYYFQKNIFGDIERIYSAAGVLVGMYRYDAWGNVQAVKVGTDGHGDVTLDNLWSWGRGHGDVTLDNL